MKSWVWRVEDFAVIFAACAELDEALTHFCRCARVRRVAKG